MQHIAIVCLAAAAAGSTLLLGWLWCMESSGSVPGWLKRINGSGRIGRQEPLL